MPPHLTLNELYAMRTKKHKARTISFDRVLELCHRRIRTVASYGGMNTFYEVPGMLVGYPLFNIFECLDYVVDHLRRAGFLIQILPPPQVCVIYISWDPKELQPTSRNSGRGHGGPPPRSIEPARPPLGHQAIQYGSGQGGSRKFF